MISVLILLALQNKPATCANSVDPDETAHYKWAVSSGSTLFVTRFWFLLFATMGMSKVSDRSVDFVSSGKKGKGLKAAKKK